MNAIDDWRLSLTMINPKDDFYETHIVGIFSLESDARIAMDELIKSTTIPAKVSLKKNKLLEEKCLNGFIDTHGLIK